MLATKKNLIRKEIEEGAGAEIAVVDDETGLRSGLTIWFRDLEENNGPVIKLRPYGLKAHIVTLTFGNFSREIIEQIQSAAPEDVQLARALVASIRSDIEIDIPGQVPSDFSVNNGAFTVKAIIRFEEAPQEDSAIIATCHEVIVPIMAAMAELIGYDIVVENADDIDPVLEGAISRSIVLRRERNPRNRLLCLRIHGEKCFVCALEPRLIYGEAGSIIEVHHIQPVSSLLAPKFYDPRTDLIPLCPNCHRAIHTSQQVPLSTAELRRLMGVDLG